MSGIAGLFRRDGAHVSAEEIAAQRDSIIHRGPDARNAWAHESIGLAHCMLWTTPESLNETLPAYDPASGLAITADARIDNRNELIAALRLRGPAGAISDSAIILAAYSKWGENCPQQLIGDFAFAIWDDRQGTLFLARDPMGIRSLYFYRSDRLFVFGSEIKAVTAVPAVPRRLNETRILDYLVNIFDDREITFYKDIFRLPAAMTLSVTRDGFRMSRYWALDPKRELRLSSDAEYTEAFRECFLETVRCRMRSAYPISSAVSGGLDSSSVACSARHLRRANGDGEPIDTFSLIFPGLPKEDLRHIDERPYIECVISSGGFRPHYIRADELSPLKDVERIQFHLDEAYFEGNTYLHWAMYDAAHKCGARVFLDGLDGDTTISHGYEYLADLIMSFRWRTLYREIGLLHKNLRMGRKRIIRDFCIAPFCPVWVYKLAYRLQGRRGDIRVTTDLVSEEFRQRLRLSERVDSLLFPGRRCFRTGREKHWEMLQFPLYAHAMELADKASAGCSVEARYPFFDRRLIELCLSLPPSQKLSGGWTRIILRRAMEGILPPEIQWRPAKGNLSPNFYRKLIEADRPVLDEIVLGGAPVLCPYVDFSAIRDAYRRYRANPLRAHDESSQIFAAVNLAIWLKHAQLAP